MTSTAAGAAIASLVLAQAQPGPAPSAPAGSGPTLDHLRQGSASLVTWALNLAADWGVRLLGVILVLVGTWAVAAWVRRTIYRALNRPRVDQTFARFAANAARWATLVMGVVAALSIFGIAPTSLAAVVGATGLAIGLALQGSLSHLAAGIMLLLLRPFKIGDTVNIAGQLGTVSDIELFHTKLDTPDNRRVVIPNGQVFGGVIENITHHGRRRVELGVGVEHGADIDATRQALLRAVSSIPGVLDDPAPEVALAGLSPSSVDWQLRVWCATADFGTVRQSAIRAVKFAIEEAGLAMPFPQMDVWNRGSPRPARAISDRSASRLSRLPDDWPRPETSPPDPA